MHRRNRNPWSGRLLLLVWIAVCGASLAALWSITDPRFEPPSASLSEFGGWWGSRDPLDAVAALCRVAASVALGYLALAATALLTSSFASLPRLRRTIARLNPAPVAGLVTAATVMAAPAAGAAPAEPAPAAAPEDGGGASMTLLEDAPTMTMLDDGMHDPEPAPKPARSSEPTRAPLPEPAGAAPASAPVAPSMVVEVQPGDHLWGISERRVARALRRQPTHAEVHDYWVALMAANAELLVEPGNPNLVVPGQHLVLPG